MLNGFKGGLLKMVVYEHSEEQRSAVATITF